MEEFVSEPIVPGGRNSSTVSMARGEPGLPQSFEWRGDTYAVQQRLEQWKESQREGGRATADLYLRRHYYKLLMSDTSQWIVYFTRQPASGQAATQRWFLYKRINPD